MENNNKGEYLNKCNLTACKSNKSAIYYNYGTSKYYCEDCAKRLNEDPYNKADALRLFGHNLCIEESKRPELLTKILEEDEPISIFNPYSKYLDNPEIKLYPKYISSSNHYTYIKDKPSQQNNDLCNCNSGKKYKKCCK